MQQKYLWGGAALVVFGAAAAYVVVDYAIHNPTSVLARYGFTAVFSGLNPNPLSDLGKGAKLKGGDKTPAAHGDSIENLNNPAEETIEPIQVDILPQPTQEPPLDFGGANPGGLDVPMDRAPRSMPYADEDPNIQLPTELNKILDGDDAPNGVLGWIEFSVPDASPPMPRGQLQIDVENLLAFAQELMHEGKYEEALALLIKIRNLDPQNTAACDGVLFCTKKLKQNCGDCPSIRIESFKPLGDWSWPFSDTMEFRPSDAGRFPLIINNPF